MREIRDKCKILVGKSAGSQLLGRASHRRENSSKIRYHTLYLLSARTQLLELYTLNCNLLHVLAVWPSSVRFYNVHGKEYREEGLDLDFLFHVRCRKVHLMLDKWPKHEVDYNWMYSVLNIVLELTVNRDNDLQTQRSDATKFAKPKIFSTG
jgi:hypothetical protein